jgi:3-dehydroquinate synthase
MGTSVRVSLGPRSYDIEIGAGTLARLGDFVAARRKVSHAVLIADAQVAARWGAAAHASLAATAVRTDLLTVPPGEASKSVAQADRLWNALVDLRADRGTVVVALGGGVVGDLAGLVAATFARGLAFFQVPTTLLAQVDSSVGGKVAVNLPRAKNMVGAFWQPAGVLIDLDTLDSLPEREYRAGLAEVVKYGMAQDADFFEYLESAVPQILARDRGTLETIVARSCRLKADVVEQDEREESGLRAILNYGHTFAHALEAVTDYGQFLHGEAVAIGMICAAKLACRLGRISPEVVSRQEVLLRKLGLPTRASGLAPQQVVAAMAHDKKVQHGKLRFVLPARLGHAELVGDVPGDPVLAVLEETL